MRWLFNAANGHSLKFITTSVSSEMADPKINEHYSALELVKHDGLVNAPEPDRAAEAPELDQCATAPEVSQDLGRKL